MSFIKRRISNKSNVKNTSIRRCINNSHYCQNFISASSRFNYNNNTKTNRLRKQFIDILNIELQQRE